jgi:tRNA nucleotidyltransferase (CCA-adding enzyme)
LIKQSNFQPPFEYYCVGGAVRDELLGLPVQDRDYVVVGSTPAQMEAAGFKPVGKDFPVFLDPIHHEEYALARTERKTSKGYKGFQIFTSPEVTLEEDLARRDFTINAIAKDAQGSLIDPFDGQRDIKARVLRHVSPAFVEDPVRILRAARFAARFVEFTIAPETLDLMKKMVEDGEVDALVPERVWQEFSKGLMEKKPSRMFEVLKNCGALEKIMPELHALWGVPQPVQHHPEIDTGVHIMLVIDYAAQQGYSLPVRFAALTHDLGKGTTPKSILPKHHGHEQRSVDLLKTVSERLRVPNECKSLAMIVAKFHGKLHQVSQMRAHTLLRFLMELDAIRQPQRFSDFLCACECDIRGRTGFEQHPFNEARVLKDLLDCVLKVDAGAVAKKYTDPEKIKQAVYDARLEALEDHLNRAQL